ncbi:MAG: hypothetical protein CMQ29_16245 [Gammaproteobacteria bacterium]|nr:hypothetical protein [Gammaproteobacteria bacterium]|tara:strand:+ start:661 stop:2238 length:1578 start_codon:yes stop_codon:yes gene_type:complete
MTGLDALRFDNAFTRELPADPTEANYVREVAGACFSRVAPTPVPNPTLVAHSPEVSAELGLSAADVTSEAFANVFAGNTVLSGMDPHAMCYGGHQFGNWAGQLGDGRAIALGEVVRDSKRQMLQLKGAGMTPYSRTADGLAVLRSSLREFLCSEAMFHLGVPTTRALSLITTGDDVVRDILYSGDPKPEPGAVVCRVAPSFIRFGNFEILAAQQDHELLKRLADHTIEHHFPELDPDADDVYVQWFEEITQRTAVMVCEWMRVGFVHGVMNTDNMSILGLTIDYGPYGWLEDYDPGWTPNTTDAASKRYRFAHQPGIAQWNLLQLANAIYPLVGKAPPLEAALKTFVDIYQDAWQTMQVAKLGLPAFEVEQDASLVNDLLELLPVVETDMPLFYRRLANMVSHEDDDNVEALKDAYYVPAQIDAPYRERLDAWVARWRERLQGVGRPGADVAASMNAVNPKYVMRNYLAQLAIDKAETGDFSLVHELLDTMRQPYAEQPEREHFAEKRPDWARTRPGCSMLSCSS